MLGQSAPGVFLQPFACPGLPGTLSLQPAPKKHHFAASDFRQGLHQMHRAGRREEVRWGRQGLLVPTVQRP